MWGSTVAAAAAQRALSIAAGATALDELTALTERCLLADLGDALPAVLAAVRDRAALEGDVTHLMAALPALVRAAQVRRRARHRPGPARRGRHRDGHPDLRRPAGRRDVPGRDGRTGHAGAHRRGEFGHRAARRRDQPRPLAGHAQATSSPVPAADLRSADPAAARRGAPGGGRGGPAHVARAVPRRSGAGRRGLGRGVPGGQRPAARPRRQAACPGGRLAGRAERGRLHRRAARAAADVRRVRAAGTPGDRAAGRAGSTAAAAGLPWSPRPTTTSISSGRRLRPGPWLPFSG